MLLKNSSSLRPKWKKKERRFIRFKVGTFQDQYAALRNSDLTFAGSFIIHSTEILHVKYCLFSPL